MVNIQKLDNRSILFDINWEDFEPSEKGLKAQSFELSVNDKPFYSGQSRQFRQALSIDACKSLLNDSSTVQIRIKSNVNNNVYLAEPVSIPFTCSNESNNSLLLIFTTIAILLTTFLSNNLNLKFCHDL